MRNHNVLESDSQKEPGGSGRKFGSCNACDWRRGCCHKLCEDIYIPLEISGVSRRALCFGINQSNFIDHCSSIVWVISWRQLQRNRGSLDTRSSSLFSSTPSSCCWVVFVAVRTGCWEEYSTHPWRSPVQSLRNCVPSGLKAIICPRWKDQQQAFRTLIRDQWLPA